MEGSGYVQNNDGSRSGWSKNIWIRSHNNAQNKVNQTLKLCQQTINNEDVVKQLKTNCFQTQLEYFQNIFVRIYLHNETGYEKIKIQKRNTILYNFKNLNLVTSCTWLLSSSPPTMMSGWTSMTESSYSPPSSSSPSSSSSSSSSSASSSSSDPFARSPDVCRG